MVTSEMQVLKVIHRVTDDIEELRNQIENFCGSSTEDKEYVYLEEMMLQGLVALDELKANGSAIIRQERKGAVQYIQKLMKVVTMSFKKKPNIKNIQAKLSLYIEELEDNLKYDKHIWEIDNSDKISIQNVIEAHHAEIMHHITQIRYHLDKVSLHKKYLDEIDHNFYIRRNKIAVQEKEETMHDKSDAVKRSDEESLQLKVRRISKTSPMKYVLQWENILEEQKEENVLNSVQFRNKCKTTSNVDIDMTQTMVKNRIEKFEGIRKPRRSSSTIEPFLDFSEEQPRRIKSYPIIEDIEGERVTDINISNPPSANSESEIIKTNINLFHKTRRGNCCNNCVKANVSDVLENDKTEINNCVSDEQEVFVSHLEQCEDRLIKDGLKKPRIVEMHSSNMGGKVSVPHLQRKKSFANLGRSSQRNLFQKTNAKLNQLKNKLNENEFNPDEIKIEFEIIEKELSSVSGIIKEKHKIKYEAMLKLFHEIKSEYETVTSKKVDEISKTERINREDKNEEKVEKQEHENENENEKKEVDVQVKTVETVDEDINVTVVELRKSFENLTHNVKSLVKFGVQVMPTAPRISQELLKRNTVPKSEAAKVEFQEIRALSLQHDDAALNPNEVVHEVEEKKMNNEESPIGDNYSSNQVDRIAKVIDELEDSLKYFHGTKYDSEYEALRHRLVQNLIKLDNIESQDNPVIKQEKKILIQRVQELMNILECLSEPITAIVYENCNTNNKDKLPNSIGTTI
ncbi:hypothetical protein FQA39_LY17060 [Lamprigera yunnana]|nr:hypothetical protein FQA39_LY17060 [Lamprigera yunnana]